MNNSTLLWTQSLISALILLVVILGMSFWHISSLKKIMDSQSQDLKYREEVIQSLLNRLQSGDLKTFLSMSPTIPFDAPEPVAHTDAHELEVLGSAEGIGIGLFDDGTEFADTLHEFGVNITR